MTTLQRIHPAIAGATLAMAFAVALVIVIAAALRGGSRLAWRAALWCGLVITVGLVLSLTVGNALIAPQGARSFNLEPFAEIQRGLRSSSRSSGPGTNLWGNVAMFVPVGVLITWLGRGALWSRVALAVVFAAALSFGIEVTQYAIGRVADIDDILLNTGGALLGAVVAAILAVLARAAGWLTRRSRDS